MDYDFSLLPRIHQKRDFIVFGSGLLVLVGYLFATALGSKRSLEILQFVVLLTALGVGGYFFASAYFDKKAFLRFIMKYAVSPLSGEEMVTFIPPCFDGIKDRNDIIDVGVRDGYVFPLADNMDCAVFIFEYTTKDSGLTKTHTHTIARIQQLRLFPHLFLEGNQVGALYSYNKSQRLELEGGF